MFKNMTERERKLGLAVLCLVPAFILFYFVTTYTGKVAENRKTLDRVRGQIEIEQDLQLSALNAVRRREYYDRHSLPNSLNNSRIQYEDYLKSLTKDCGLDIKVFGAKKSGKTEITYSGQNGRTKVFDQVTFTLSGKGELEQITNFLHKFYSLNLVQRISQLNIDPIMVGGGGAKDLEREGNYKLSMSIDVASMVSGDESREFQDDMMTLKKSLDEYNLAILNRNMFGPANNAPKLVTGQKKTVTENSANVSYQLTASDQDKNDQVSFELISSEIKGAKLEQGNPDSPRATFSCPPLEPGIYKYRVIVTDTGYPNKSVEEDCVLTVKKKTVVVSNEPTKEPDPEPVFFASATEITGTWTHGVTQNTEIWIRPTDERTTYQIGSTFELDGKDWTIRNINVREIQIECDGEILTYNLKGRNAILSNPLNREQIAAKESTPDVSAAAIKGN